MTTAKVKQSEELIESLASDELPDGWARATLRDVTESVPNVDPKSEPDRDFGYIDISSIDNRECRILGEKHYLGKNAPSRARRPIRPGDILFSNVRTYLRNIAIVPADCVAQLCSTGFTVIRSNGAANPSYLFYYSLTDGFIGPLTEQQTGSNYPATCDRIVLSSQIEVAPLAEQIRIVAKVEALFAEVNRVRGRLEKVPKILKAFRQSVLSAACSGRLTEDWREKHLEAEPAATLINRIRAFRTSKCTGRQILEPVLVEPSSAEFDDVPDEWIWAEFGSIIGELRNGISTRPEQEPPGNRILRISSVRSGTVLLEEVRYLPNSDELRSVYRLQDGDLLFTRYNGSLDLLGVCGMVRGLGKSIVLYPDKLMRVRIDHPYVVPDYAEIFFQTPAARDRMTAKSKSSAGQQGISGTDVKAQPLALPPFEEQKEIVRRVEALFTLADTIEKQVESATLRGEKITQAVLAKAFRGELVPTEAELARRESRPYESASVHLEGIKAEREKEIISKNASQRQGRQRQSTIKR